MATDKQQLDSEAPIYINLSGDYKIPVTGEAPRVGSISGDLRLAALDAFLLSLGSAMAKNDGHRTGTGLTYSLALAVDRCLAENRGYKSVTLSVTSKLTTDSNELQYNFSVLVKK